MTPLQFTLFALAMAALFAGGVLLVLWRRHRRRLADHARRVDDWRAARERWAQVGGRRRPEHWNHHD